VKFKSKIRYWSPEKGGGLAVVDLPAKLIAELGGLRQMRVTGTINGVAFESNVMPGGSGRLALSVSKKMMAAGGTKVGADAEFVVTRAAAGG
jgi:hypothetical protein